ncbi:DNA (cytosine-5)-methyltransferase 1 [Bradyrhizobium elkanii]|uniref:DNA cytosine methyltransferase n=1 Tax=Bradyrhizobium elkanii TaxID=29448 RepID=UPI0035192918
MQIGVVDLFCGVGGLSLGFKNEGFDVIAGVDSDVTCQYAYETNIGADFLGMDITRLSGAKIGRIFESRENDYRVLIGCAPCTPFSLYSGRYRKARRADNKWALLTEFSRIARLTKPDVISMENVPQLTRHKVFQAFIEEIENSGYHVTFQRVRADHYGVPQRRSRLVLIASRFGKVTLPSPTHLNRPLTVRDAIGNLPTIKAGEPCRGDRLHVTRRLTPTNMKRLQSTVEGGSWRDWDSDLQLACHKKIGGESFRSVYGRMSWDSPSPVITTQCLGIGNGRFGHPEQDRAISIREAALLQTFPKSFRFVAPKDPIRSD